LLFVATIIREATSALLESIHIALGPRSNCLRSIQSLTPCITSQQEHPKRCKLELIRAPCTIMMLKLASLHRCLKPAFLPRPAKRELHLAPPFLLDSYTPRYQLISSIDASRKRSLAYAHLRNCNLCPRLCNVNRYEKTGHCLIGAETVKVNVIGPHFGEEPCIQGHHGVRTPKNIHPYFSCDHTYPGRVSCFTFYEVCLG
jgi:hypothetical protein